MISRKRTNRRRIAAAAMLIASGAVSLLLLRFAWRLANGAPPDIAAAREYETLRYQWNKLTIVIESDAGVFSPALQAARNANDRIGSRTRGELLHQAQVYFAGVSSMGTEYSLQFDADVARFGLGHALPYVAAIAVENLQRPIPAVFGNLVPVDDMQRGQLVTKIAGSVDSTRPGELRIVVHATYRAFLAAAARGGHSFARAYFDPQRNEIGLFLDIDRFRRFYGMLEKERNSQEVIVPAFIGFVSTTFNDDSGHELAHAYQSQSGDPAYSLPVISEGEALVQGLTRSRAGTEQTLLYNDVEEWTTGRNNPDVLLYRIQTREKMGSPMSAEQVRYLQQLRQWKQRNELIPLRVLLSLDYDGFYADPAREVRKRYLQSWILCLAAVRHKEVAEALRSAVNARLAGREPEAPTLAILENRLADQIDDPERLLVTREKMWQDAERMYLRDQNLAALIYLWVFYADPADHRAIAYVGDAFFANWHFEQAMKFYELAREVGPGRPIPLARIGDVLSKSGHLDEAVPLWRAALAAKQPLAADELKCQEFVRERLAETTGKNNDADWLRH
jgi:hypothetical protein